MQNLISNTFAISAQRPTVSIDHTDNYYLIEASGITPAVNDARWQYVPVGGNVLVPTAAYPYLWHKSITYLTDGTALAPVIEFGGSLGQNGIDYDLVPSHSSILKDENNNLTPSEVSCTLIKRNADGSATNQSSIPAGYSIQVLKDAAATALYGARGANGVIIVTTGKAKEKALDIQTTALRLQRTEQHQRHRQRITSGTLGMLFSRRAIPPSTNTCGDASVPSSWTATEIPILSTTWTALRYGAQKVRMLSSWTSTMRWMPFLLIALARCCLR